MDLSDKSVLAQLSNMGVRIYRKVIVSPFSTRDSPGKCALINFMIEHCGYTLTDERGFPKAPVTEATP